MIHHNTAKRRIGFYLINTPRPRKQLGINACISSRITTVIQVVRYYQINYNWYNEPFAVSQYKCLYLDMHGLIFETSVWLLAGSTRLLVHVKSIQQLSHSKRAQCNCTDRTITTNSIPTTHRHNSVLFYINSANQANRNMHFIKYKIHGHSRTNKSNTLTHSSILSYFSGLACVFLRYSNNYCKLSTLYSTTFKGVNICKSIPSERGQNRIAL